MPGEPINLDRRFLSRLFPGLRLVGAIRSAFDLRKLMIAALGLALLQLGWSVLDGLFPDSAPMTPATSFSVGQIRTDAGDQSWASIGLRRAHGRLSEPFWNLVSPLMALFDPQSGWAAMLHALLAMIWLFLIWAICGCAICRIAVVRVARMQQTSLGQAVGFAFRNFVQLILTPMIPLGLPGILRHDSRGIWCPYSGTLGRQRVCRHPVPDSALRRIDHDSAGNRSGGCLAARACRNRCRSGRRARCLEPIVRVRESAHRRIGGARRRRLGARDDRCHSDGSPGRGLAPVDGMGSRFDRPGNGNGGDLRQNRGANVHPFRQRRTRSG